jgi:hypothetical protein
MSWSACLFDSMTGLLAEQVDLPSFSWALTVGDCSLSTTRDKGAGEGDASGLRLPWAAVPGRTAAERHGAIAMWRRGMCLMWDGAPVVAGLIGPKGGTAEDVSIDLLSPLEVLAHRYAVREGAFGTGTTTVEEGERKGQAVSSVTTDSIHWSGESLRSIACRLGALACSKPGGALPIDWPWLGEAGGHERTYDGFNVANSDIKTLITNLCSVEGGPDVQLRPYLADSRHIRWRMEAGSDPEPYLGDAPVVPVLTCFPGGGTAQGLSWAELAPAMRVYATGAGQDQATLCHLSEDLSLCRRRDPWPLVESRASGSSDWGTAGLVRSHADAALAASRLPMVQWQCEVDATSGPVVPGRLWPGQRVLLDLDGSPIWPDGRYALRVMEMAGDEGSTVKLTFDQTVDPWEGVA